MRAMTAFRGLAAAGHPVLVLLAAVVGLAGSVPGQTLFGQWSRHPFAARWSFKVDVGDIEPDGDRDLLLSGVGLHFSPFVLFNDGAAKFSELQLQTSGPPASRERGACFADLDGDGDLDVAEVQSLYGYTRVYFYQVNGRFVDGTAASGLPRMKNNQAIAAADVDRDGDVDLVAGAFAGQNQLYLNDGKGRFKDATVAWMPGDAKATIALAVADLNGDGWLDIVAGNSNSLQTNDVYLNTRRGGFVVQALSPLRRSTWKLLAGDLDGDRDVDVVVLNSRFGHATELHLNDGKGSFTDRSDLLPNPGRWFRPFAGALADFDGDGDLDLCLAGQDTPACQKDAFRYYENKGGARLVDATSRALPRAGMIVNTWALGAGDLDGDADVDLAVLQVGAVFSCPKKRLLLVNLRRHAFAPNDPVVGSPWAIDLFADSGHHVLPAVAAAKRRLRAGALGTLWLDPSAMVLLQPATIGPGRTARVTVPLPNDPFLKGKTIYYQALDFVPGNLAASRLTNFGQDAMR